MVLRYFDHALGSSCGRAKHTEGVGRTLERNLARSRDAFCRATPWPTVPPTGTLILVADALVRRVAGNWHTTYCCLLRTPRSRCAVIVPPVTLPGKETQPGWRIACDQIPDTVRARIVAVVSDGHRGIVNYAKRNHWILQRCHFHLVSSIQGRRSWFRSGKHRDEATRTWRLVRHVLEAESEHGMEAVLQSLDDLALSTRSPVLRRLLRGFVNNYEDYRSYRYHPTLHLPTTSNTAESFISHIQNLMFRMRGVRSVPSYLKWIEAIAKHRSRIVCNGASTK